MQITLIAAVFMRKHKRLRLFKSTSYHQTLQRFCYRHKEWTFSRYVKYGARLSILLSIFKPEHYSILIYTRDIPTPNKARALNNFFKNVSFQMS